MIKAPGAQNLSRSPLLISPSGQSLSHFGASRPELAYAETNVDVNFNNAGITMIATPTFNPGPRARQYFMTEFFCPAVVCNADGFFILYWIRQDGTSQELMRARFGANVTSTFPMYVRFPTTIDVSKATQAHYLFVAGYSLSATNNVAKCAAPLAPMFARVTALGTFP